VIPKAAIFIVGDDDRRVAPDWALHDAADQRDHVILTGQEIGRAGVLVTRADRFDERHRR
jgi:hypothetical protein